MAVSRCPDWSSFDVSCAPSDGPVAFCGDLSPASLLGAYRRGILPLPAPNEFARNLNEFRYEDQVAEGAIAIVGDGDGDGDGDGHGDSEGDGVHDPYGVAWWSPNPRLTMRTDGVHLGRNVRKQLRRDPQWLTTADHAFERVTEECRAGRAQRWLTDTLLESLLRLHDMGWAHSIEVWEADELIGGAFGIGIGATLSGDSMFNRRPYAARVAVADMAARFRQVGGVLIDAQWDSPYLRSLGAEPMPRDRYLKVLAGSSHARSLPRQPLPARRLMAASGPAPPAGPARGRAATPVSR